jgi:hypothetical protein
MVQALEAQTQNVDFVKTDFTSQVDFISVQYSTTTVICQAPVNYVDFEVLTEVTTKSSVLWDIISCSLVKVS